MTISKIHTTCAALTLLASLSAPLLNAQDQVPEPYEPLTGCTPGTQLQYSPDPLSGYVWDNPQATDKLQIYELKPKAIICDKPEKMTATSGDSFTARGGCNVRFDFGVVSPGWLEIDCAGGLPEGVTCSISEHNEPSRMNGTSQSQYKTKVPVKYGDSYRLELNNALYEGVRYGWVHIPATGGEVNITNVRLVCQAKPTNYLGSFECDNTMLNRIWYTGAYTVRTNLLENCFGAILMERGDRFSWTGDAYISQAAALVAFGNYDFIKKNIDHTSNQSNGIFSYELYWVQSVIDYYNYTGDTEFLKKYKTNIYNKLARAKNNWGTHPNLNYYGWDERLGAGFENGSCDENQLAYKMLCIQTWRMAADVMRRIGNTRDADKYDGFIEKYSAILEEDRSWINNLALFSATDAINAGTLTSDEIPAVWDKIFSDRLQRLSYSPFNQFFVLNAMSRLNRYGEALHTIDDLWGGMIRYGGTTFFEVYRPSWNDYALAENDPVPNCQVGFTSLTHPWSAGVTKWLSEEVLGIKPVKPGFDEFSVTPHLTCGLTRVSGTVPTPKGEISFAIDTQTGSSRLTVPEGSAAAMAIPKMGAGVTGVKVDGNPVEIASEDTHFAYLPQMDAGEHEVSFAYTSAIESPEPVETLHYLYEKPLVAEDTITKGDWRGKYGKDGYFLFNYDGNDLHRSNLPAGCSVNMRLGGQYRYPGTEHDPRSLQSPDEWDPQRQVGVFFTLDPADCLETMTLDLDYQPEAPYDLSFYFIDWERGTRRSAIEIFDFKTLQMIAPVQIVREYGSSRYITLRIDRPVRFRVNNIRGDNAAIAGMFFDKPASSLGTSAIDKDVEIMPGKGEITVKATQDSLVTLHNISGEQTFSGIVHPGTTTLSPIEQGVYVVNGQKILVN